jgi:hypothetical protein
LLRLVANQLKVGIESWDEYGQREQTRREHLVELQTVFGFQPFTIGHYRQAVQLLTELAMQTDKGIVLARALMGTIEKTAVVIAPALNAVERASAEAIGPRQRGVRPTPWRPLRTCIAGDLGDLRSRRQQRKWRRGWPGGGNHPVQTIELRHCWNTCERAKRGEALMHKHGMGRWFEAVKKNAPHEGVR